MRVGPTNQLPTSLTLQEADNSRATLTDIFCNTNGFSAKTVQAIYKETLYKARLTTPLYSQYNQLILTCCRRKVADQRIMGGGKIWRLTRIIWIK